VGQVQVGGAATTRAQKKPVRDVGPGRRPDQGPSPNPVQNGEFSPPQIQGPVELVFFLFFFFFVFVFSNRERPGSIQHCRLVVVCESPILSAGLVPTARNRIRYQRQIAGARPGVLGEAPHLPVRFFLKTTEKKENDQRSARRAGPGQHGSTVRRARLPHRHPGQRPPTFGIAAERIGKKSGHVSRKTISGDMCAQTRTAMFVMRGHHILRGGTRMVGANVPKHSRGRSMFEGGHSGPRRADA